MIKPSLLRLIVVLAACMSLQACSVAAPEKPQRRQQRWQGSPNTTTVESQQIVREAPVVKNPLDAVEIVWAAPEENVEKFIIRYGFTPNNLQYEEAIESSFVERLEDPEQGLVYRYVLHNITSDKDVYVSLASMYQGTVSPPSQVFEVKAENSQSAAVVDDMIAPPVGRPAPIMH